MRILKWLLYGAGGLLLLVVLAAVAAISLAVAVAQLRWKQLA